MDRRDPGGLVLLHGTDNVYRVAVAVVGVCYDRHLDSPDNAPGVVHHLAKGQKPYIWAAQERGGRTEARHVHRLEPRLLDGPGRKCVVGSRASTGSGPSSSSRSRPGPTFRCIRSANLAPFRYPLIPHDMVAKRTIRAPYERSPDSASLE